MFDVPRTVKSFSGNLSRGHRITQVAAVPTEPHSSNMHLTSLQLLYSVSICFESPQHTD